MIPNLTNAEYEHYLILVHRRRALDRQIRAIRSKAALGPAPVWGPCTRCGYTWTGRNAQKPQCCSRCRSRLWAKPRKVPRTLQVNSPAMTTPVTRPSGLTPPPPPTFRDEAPQPEHSARPVEPPPVQIIEESVEETVPPPVVEAEEGPKCCSAPHVVDGVCLNCGAGLPEEKLHG